MLFKLENNYFFKMFAKGLAWLILAYGIGFAVWTVFFTETGNGDNVEHIHATWLVAYGKIPYKDFFQHHNPLLWYLFAPVIRLFGNPMAILDAAHGISLLAGVMAFFVVYKISTRFFASGFAALLGLLTLCPPYYYIYCFNYNPDTFMALFFAIGLYYLFAYWEKAKLSALLLSFASFFIAFMFTQKILTVLAVLGLVSLYVFYRKKTPLRHIVYASLLPLSGLVLFGAFLYNEGILGLYWQSNYLFNVKMQEYYGNYQINVMDYQVLVISVCLACISVACFVKSANLYYRVIAILFIAELLQRCFYFSISPYYMLPLMIFAVCLNSVLFEWVIRRRFVFVYVALGISVFYAAVSETKYLSTRGNDRSFVRYIAANVTPCDYVISGFLGNQSVISKDPHYYWSLLGHVDIAGEEMGISPKPDLNALVLKYKPKLISGEIYWNNYYRNRGRDVPVQQVSPVIIDKYYIQTPFKGMYLLRYEYQGKNCRYDEKKGEWLYAG